MHEAYVTQLVGLYPAPGWRVFACWIDDLDQAYYYEVPVIGWAVLRTVPRSGKLNSYCTDDEVQLYIFDEFAGTMSEQAGVNSTYKELPPGKELELDTKAELEHAVRTQMQERRRPDATSTLASFEKRSTVMTK